MIFTSRAAVPSPNNGQLTFEKTGFKEYMDMEASGEKFVAWHWEVAFVKWSLDKKGAPVSEVSDAPLLQIKENEGYHNS